MDGLAVPAHGFKLLAGTGNRPLAEEIARQLGIDLCKLTLTRFADGEIFVGGHDITTRAAPLPAISAAERTSIA